MIIEMDLKRPWIGLTPRLKEIIDNAVKQAPAPTDNPQTIMVTERFGFLNHASRKIKRDIAFCSWEIQELFHQNGIIRISLSNDYSFVDEDDFAHTGGWDTFAEAQVENGIWPLNGVQAVAVGAEFVPNESCEEVPLVWFGVSADIEELKTEFPYLCGYAEIQV